MTIIANNPYEMLTQSAELIQERGQGYGEIENNFQLIADLFSLRVGRPFHPYEACILLECVKDARMFASPMLVDNYLDGINYKAFAALFAEDYSLRRSSLNDVAYQRKEDLRKAEMKPVEVKNKSAKTKDFKGSTTSITVDDLEKIDG
jgi:Domain of unknown function (DUF6378)